MDVENSMLRIRLDSEIEGCNFFKGGIWEMKSFDYPKIKVIKIGEEVTREELLHKTWKVQFIKDNMVRLLETGKEIVEPKVKRKAPVKNKKEEKVMTLRNRKFVDYREMNDSDDYYTQKYQNY